MGGICTTMCAIDVIADAGKRVPHEMRHTCASLVAPSALVLGISNRLLIYVADR